MKWIYSPGLNAAPRDFDPTEFGFGIGTVSGLFLGAGACLFLVVVLVLRDAYLAAHGTKTASSVDA